MGCGKSTIGRILHRKHGFAHLDTDHHIEKNERRPIADIFSNEGEEYYRNLETQLLRDVLENNCRGTIISTGGGMVVKEENRRLLQKLGFVVWLSCSAEEIYQRTSRSTHRPLLQCNDPMTAIAELLGIRTPMYEDASHMKISTSGLDFDEIACGIHESASYHFSNPSETRGRT